MTFGSTCAGMSLKPLSSTMLALGICEERQRLRLTGVACQDRWRNCQSVGELRSLG
jgi:hypothetical protein